MSREDTINQLKTDHFDILIIGGGATGCGIALDAAARALKVALVEKEDFGSGTSARSTKLIHGGVRYLEQAVLRLDQRNSVWSLMHGGNELLLFRMHVTWRGETH